MSTSTALYQTRATAQAGRQGHVATDDGLLALDLAYPKALGGQGNATNPEQLFAAGYAACFSNAILHVARAQKIALQSAPVTAEVGLVARADGGFALQITLAVQLDSTQAEALVMAADAVCPYSHAIRGNVAVQIRVNDVLIGA
jgi:Ohr subfamily peroxiredoxin